MAAAASPWAVARALARTWTEPHATIMGAAERRRARLASSLLLVLVPLAFIFMVAYRPEPGAPAIEAALPAGTMVLLVAAYALSRSRHARAAAFGLVAIPWVALSVSFSAEPLVNHDILYYGVIPMLLAGILLRPVWAAAFAVFNLAGTAALALDPAQASIRHDIADHVLFQATAAALVIVASAFLERSAREAERANERLRQADAFRLQLLNTIAHDLASPLQPVILQLDLAKKGADPQKALAIVDRNVRHLQRLVGDVRDLSKLESGHLALDRRPVDVAQLVREATEAFNEPAREKQIALETHVPGPIEAHADPDRLNQVLYNLLTNALKFTPAGGRVAVQAAANNGHATVAVRDSGRGLSAEEIPRLFRPFSQVHERHETKEKGTGLGLFISKGIVEGHGGRIWVESEGRGRGSTFRFEFPRTPT